MIEYYKFELMNQLMEHYFNSCATTLDTSDFVPQRYLKRVQKRLFKEFKAKMWTLSFEYRKFKKYWKRNQKIKIDENLSAIYAKYNIEFSERMTDNNHFLNRVKELGLATEQDPANNERGVWGDTSPAGEYNGSTNSIEDEESEFDSLEQKDGLASAIKNEQLTERSSAERDIEPL